MNIVIVLTWGDLESALVFVFVLLVDNILVIQLDYQWSSGCTDVHCLCVTSIFNKSDQMFTKV